MKVSIIVPIFNGELYLKDCINSIINQTYSEWELILVDDGSTDNTLIICEKFAVIDKRIKVIHKENGGVSSARNKGLDIATGDWVMFPDADDWIEPKTIEVAITYLVKYDLDIISWNHYYSYEDKEIKRHAITPAELIREGDDLKWFLIDTMFPLYDKWVNNIHVSALRGVWSKMFKASLISTNKLRFNESIIIAEDSLFCFDFIVKSKRMMVLNEYLTHYRVHSGSVMRNGYKEGIDKNNKLLLIEFYKRIECYLKEDPMYQTAYVGLVMNNLNRSIDNYFAKSGLNRSGVINQLEQLLNQSVYQRAFSLNIDSRVPFIYRIFAFLVRNKYSHILYFVKKIENRIKLKN